MSWQGGHQWHHGMPSNLECVTHRTGAIEAGGHGAMPDWPNGDPMSSAQNHISPGHNLNAGYRRKKSALSRRDVVISSLCASAMIAALVIVAEFGVPWISQPILSVAINNVDVDSSQIGRITLRTDENECELMKFNNETGRTIENDVRLRKDVTLDAHDVPVPTGTAHRLDAISRSFLIGGH
jgi:hypothetical protein